MPWGSGLQVGEGDVFEDLAPRGSTDRRGTGMVGGSGGPGRRRRMEMRRKGKAGGRGEGEEGCDAE